MVPIPSGMKVTYREALDVLDHLYTVLQIDKTTTTIIQYLDSIDKAKTLIDAMDAVKSIDRLTRTDVEHLLQTVFSANKTLEVPLSKVISSFDDLLIIDKRILTLNSVFQSVSHLCTQLDTIEKRIDRLVTQLESDPLLNKTLVTSLYHLVYTASVQFDMMGVILSEYQRIEHNFVITLRRLVETSHV